MSRDGAPNAALDLRGLRCPLPVLKTRKALLSLNPGDELTVLADDPLAAVDIPNFVRESGDEFAGQHPLERGWRFVIRKAAR